MSAGFGPVSTSGGQYAYVDADGNVVPLQVARTERGLKGEIDLRSGRPYVAQDVLPFSSTPRYYQADPVTAGARGALELGRAIRRTPSALLPGAADLIPSPEAVQTGFREGPLPMVRQMGREFAQGIPVSLGAAGVLATPAVAPFAPGIGAGMVATAATRAANEAVRQQTGEGIVPKLRQVFGTAPRSGVASPPRVGPAVTPQIRPLNQAQRNEAQRRQNRNEVQKRIDLARERFNPMRGEFGLTELFLGR
jgi:hypothetical protein